MDLPTETKGSSEDSLVSWTFQLKPKGPRRTLWFHGRRDGHFAVILTVVVGVDLVLVFPNVILAVFGFVLLS